MSSKKRYIPIVALGALLIALLAVLPAAGAGEVSFIVPGDIHNDNDGSLVDPTPDEQEWSRQGGQVGILYEDSDLDRPVRRVLVLETDTRPAGDLVRIVAYSKTLKNVQLPVDSNAGRTGNQLLAAGDYVFIDGDGATTAADADNFRTVRRVVSVSRTDDGDSTTDQGDRRYTVTLDAAFPESSTGNEVMRRVNDSFTEDDAFADLYMEIGLAEVVNITSTTPLTRTLQAPILPSNMAPVYSTTDGDTRSSAVSRRLGGNPDSRLNERDVLAFRKDSSNAPGERLELTDAEDTGEITYENPATDPDASGPLPAPGAGDYYIMYWAAVKNHTASDITIQSQTVSPQAYTLQETSDGSGEFAAKIDLVPTTLTVDWEDIPVPMLNGDTDPSPAGKTVTLTNDSGENRDYEGYKVKHPRDTVPAPREGAVAVEVVPDFANPPMGIPRMPVNERDSVVVNYPDGSETIRVETTKPVFANFDPAHNDIGDDSRPSVSAQATDADSGLAESKVGIVFAIKPAGATSAVLKGPVDSSGNIGAKLAPNDADADAVSGGFDVTSRLDSDEDLSGDGEIWWWAKATDKAGNVAYSDRELTTSAGVDDACVADDETKLLADANSDNTLCDPYVIKVDGTKPRMLHAETGRWWDASLSTGDSDDKTEYRRDKARANSILVIFDEPLDAATVQASDFEVNDATPSSADVQEVKVRDDNVEEDDPSTDSVDESSGDGNRALYVSDAVPQFVGQSRGYVFLTLSQDMTPNAQPKVEMVDKVSDLAGNQQASAQRDAQADDRIAPELTVSIEEGVRPVTRKDVTVRITSNENIGTPKVSYYKVDKTSPVDNPETNVDESVGDSAMTLSNAQKASARFVSAREYTATITPSSDGLYTVYVTAADSSGSNNGVAGQNGGVADSGGTPDPLIDISSDTKAILFERDKAIASPDFDPDKSGVNTTFETDDPNGFIRIDYSAEGTEYSATTRAYQPARDADPDATPPVTARDPIPGRAGDDLDTHGRLTIVSATLDGADISGDISSNTDGNIFQYHLDGMAVGDYDLELTVRDEAGNSNAAPHKGTIKIIERKPYKLTLNPGWNLVSLPGQPADTDINEVIPSDHPIDAVRGYDPMVPGAWLIAEEGGDGTFTGTLETIESGTAYWIKTGSFQALEVDIPKPTPGSLSLLPTISISQGWNLVPILDVDGDFELAEQTADDNYFSGLTAGSIAAIYTYNTVTNSWMSVSQTGVELGKGYWVYATKPGVIVP